MGGMGCWDAMGFYDFLLFLEEDLDEDALSSCYN